MSDSFDDTPGQDQVTETTTEGWGSRLAGSFVAAAIGFILVPAAIVLLYWNEGRAVDAIRALDRGGKSVIEVTATAVDPNGEGRLVHLSGQMQPASPARDPVFNVTADGLLRLERQVEMFQWEEETSTRSQSNVGGSKRPRRPTATRRRGPLPPSIPAVSGPRTGTTTPECPSGQRHLPAPKSRSALIRWTPPSWTG